MSWDARYIIIEGKQLNRTTCQPSEALNSLFIQGLTNIDLHTIIEQWTTKTQDPLQLGGKKLEL